MKHVFVIGCVLIPLFFLTVGLWHYEIGIAMSRGY